MRELLKAWKSDVGKLLLLATLGSLLHLILGVASPEGFVTVRLKTLLIATGWVVAVFVWVLSYAVKLWKKDRRREQLKFAKEMGHHICACTPEGTIAVLDPALTNRGVKFHVCPLCKSKYQTGKEQIFPIAGGPTSSRPSFS